MPEQPRQAPSLEIRILGPFEVRAAGATVEKASWRRPKAELLVKLLAVSPGHRLHRERVMDLLWPDLAPEAAANQLSKILSLARRALEPSLPPNHPSIFIDTADHHVALRGPGGLTVDADRFEREAAVALAGIDPSAYEAALACYGGELLADEPFAEWAVDRRDRLRELRRRLLARLAALLDAAGEAERAVDAYEALLACDAADEEAHRALMRLHARCGDRSAAARQYQRCVEALRRELDVDPDPETVELHEGILAGELERQAPRTNLPAAVTSFVGREEAIAVVSSLLVAHRLVTLKGTGGVGKTRLAVEIGVRMFGEYPDGVWFADLSPIHDPGLVARPLASALGVAEERGRPLADSVADALAGSRALVVLDNCEHVAEAAARFAALIVRAAPGVRLLATSREALGISGERVWPVPPLSLPEGDSTREALGCEAVRLFAERAALTGRPFTLDERNATSVARLCARLDGIPLAIELAAARTRSLTVEQVLERLDDRFRLLAAGGRDALPRQRTLRGAIDWSYDLLSEDERRLFERLSVFAGGFTLEAAEAVSSAGDHEGISALVDKSLVVAEEGRFRMLETIRAYGEERLRDAGGDEDARRRHYDWCAALAAEAAVAFDTPRESEWLSRLEAEHDNLRAALRWCVRSGATTELAALVTPLAHYWSVRGHWAEGRGLLEAACARAGEVPPAARANLLQQAGTLAFRQSDTARARELFEASLALRRELPGAPGLARNLYQLATTLRNLSEPAAAEAMHREGLAISESAGDTTVMALAANGLGVLAVDRGDYEAGLAWFERGLAAFRRSGNARGTAMVLHNMGEIAMRADDLARAERLFGASREASLEHGFRDLYTDGARALGYIALRKGQHDAAVEWYRSALEGFLEIGDRRGLSTAVGGLCFAAAARGDGREALLLRGIYDALCDSIGLVLPPDEQAKTEELLAGALEDVPDGEASAIYETGRALSFERAVARALGR